MLIPVIKVRDKDTGRIHIVGTNRHDMLTVKPECIEYYNLQNGCGSDYTYEFLPHDGYDPAEWWNDPNVEMVTLEEWLKLSEEEIEESAKAKIEFYKAVAKMWQDEVKNTADEIGITGDSGGEILE